MRHVTRDNWRGRVEKLTMLTGGGCLQDAIVRAMAVSYEPLGTISRSTRGDESATQPRSAAGGN